VWQVIQVIQELLFQKNCATLTPKVSCWHKSIKEGEG